MSKDAKFICKFLSDNFESPCQYTFNGLDASEFIGTDDWCEKYCSASAEMNYEPCWERMFELLQELKKEQGDERNDFRRRTSVQGKMQTD